MKLSRSLKFGIGLFAELCASLFPHLVAQLRTHSEAYNHHYRKFDSVALK
jgi:hypothetical protein